jgi:hypothetical protein
MYSESFAKENVGLVEASNVYGKIIYTSTDRWHKFRLNSIHFRRYHLLLSLYLSYLTYNFVLLFNGRNALQIIFLSFDKNPHKFTEC